jgi:hypothetical protein
MLNRFSLLLLVAAIGCTQGGSPDAVPDVTTDISTEPASTEVALQLPDDTATSIEFYCPGMT